MMDRKRFHGKLLSIVVPAYNEAESLDQLSKEIDAVCNKLSLQYEVIFVNDGSTDGTQQAIEKLHARYGKRIKGIQFRTNYGKAAALHAGFQAATGDYVLTLDADLQDDPAELPKLFEKLDEGFDLVTGWKLKRRDSFIKNKTSKVFNAATNAIAGTNLHDHNCGYKLYRAETAKDLNLYGELHRYIPVLLTAQGYKVAEVRVAHRKRSYGSSKYGPIRFINGALDLLTVLFITKFRSRPLHFFGYIGLVSLAIGVLIGLYLSIYKFSMHRSIGSRPLLQLAVLLVVVGVQITVTGIVAEMMTASGHERMPAYKIRKVLSGEPLGEEA
jgi:glycosyltransferase involved in cell wall biosynthesis